MRKDDFLIAALACSLLACFLAAACPGGTGGRPGDNAPSPASGEKPVLMRAVDGIPGWRRTGDVETYTKAGLYGYIDGGAELVLQYGFRELAVFRFERAADTAAAPGAAKELVLEIYRMESGPAAFGFYSTKLEGEEAAWPGVGSDHWVSPGQGGLVKGEYAVNIMAPECTDREIGEFAAALEPKVPGRGTERPKGLDRLPSAGLVPGSRRYIKGPLAAQNESPLLEADFWGFGGTTEAYSAKYGFAPSISKLVVVEFKTATGAATLEESVLAVFDEFLLYVRRDGGLVEGRNEAGRWFLFKAKGAVAALVLGDPGRDAALARLDLALANASI